MKLQSLYFSLIITISSCSNEVVKQDITEQEVVKEVYSDPQNKNFMNTFTKKANTILSNNEATSYSHLQDRIIENIEENSEIVIMQESGSEMTGNQIYHYLEERTYVTGTSFLCDRCPDTHLSHATAFAISNDGIFMTNYHVVESKEGQDASAIFISDSKGNIYNVIDILAASQSNDLAIIKVDTKGVKLKYIPFAKEELLGEDIYLMGHPFAQYYYMSKGIIARKYINDRDNEPRLAVTAEFGQGSSGGPFVNTKGELVAMVTGTYSNYTMNDPKHGYLQMLTKEVIPVSTMWNYVKKE